MYDIENIEMNFSELWKTELSQFSMKDKNNLFSLNESHESLDNLVVLSKSYIGILMLEIVDPK